MSKDRISITWSDNLDRFAEAIVRKYAAEMVAAGIPTHTSTTHSGDLKVNRSGAIAFALAKLATD